MQNQGSRRKGKGKNGRRKKAGGNAKQAGRVNPQGPAAPFSVVYAECFCGSINCDGCEYSVAYLQLSLCVVFLTPGTLLFQICFNTPTAVTKLSMFNPDSVKFELSCCFISQA